MAEEEEKVPAIAPVPRVIPKLEGLCLPVAAEGFRDNIYLFSKDKLSSMVSNAVFDKLHAPHARISEVLLEEMKEKFKINHITLGRNNYDSIHRILVYGQTLEKLELLELTHAEKNIRIKSKKDDGMYKKGRPIRINIQSLLKSFLNEKSRDALRCLTICGEKVIFRPNWIEEVHTIVSSLTALNIIDCSLSNDQFTTLCELYTGLTCLSIGRTEVDHLSGIEQIKGMIFLSLEDLKFKTATSLTNVFLLPKLKILDISSNNGEEDTALQLADCEGTLPNLLLLDCSGNKLLPNTIRRLFAQHPRLIQMSVINTAFDRRLQAEFIQYKENAKFFTVADLSSCSDSLKLYVSNARRTMLILVRVHEIISNELMAQDENDVGKCAKNLIEILKHPKQSFENQVMAIKCFRLLVDDDDIYENFTFEEKESMVLAMCSAIVTADWKEANSEKCPGYHLIVTALDFFSNTTVTDDDSEFLRPVCTAFLKLFLDMQCRFEDDFIRSCCRFISENPEDLGALRQFTKLELDQIKTSLVTIIQFKADANMELYAAVLGLLTFVVGFKTDNICVNEYLLQLIFQKLSVFEGEPLVVDRSFKVLELIYFDLEEKGKTEIFLSRNFDVIKSFLSNHNHFNQIASIKFLLTIHKHYMEDADYKPYTRAELEELMPKIWKMVTKFRFLTFFRNDNLFNYMQTVTKNSDIRNWAYWVFSRLEDYY